MLLTFFLTLSKGAYCSVIFIVDIKHLFVNWILKKLMNTCSN